MSEEAGGSQNITIIWYHGNKSLSWEVTKSNLEPDADSPSVKMRIERKKIRTGLGYAKRDARLDLLANGEFKLTCGNVYRSDSPLSENQQGAVESIYEKMRILELDRILSQIPGEGEG